MVLSDGSLLRKSSATESMATPSCEAKRLEVQLPLKGALDHLQTGVEAELVVLRRVQSVDDVEDGLAADLRVSVHVHQPVVGTHRLGSRRADPVAEDLTAIEGCTSRAP